MSINREYCEDDYINEDLTKDSPTQHKKDLLTLIAHDIFFDNYFGSISTSKNLQFNLKVWLTDGHIISGKMEIS